MLQFSTIEPGTLEVLKHLMTLPELNDFFLVGGTCLALRYGHRISVDLDLFSISDFNNDTIIKVLENKFPRFNYSDSKNPVGVFGFIGDVKVDFINHHIFKQIGKSTIEDGIRMFSDQDVMAMKISAILNRAQKKDLWDVAELLQNYSIQEFIDCYNKKYPSQQLLISIPQALTYFNEADASEDPISLKGQNWENVKKIIQNKVNQFLS